MEVRRMQIIKNCLPLYIVYHISGECQRGGALYPRDGTVGRLGDTILTWGLCCGHAKAFGREQEATGYVG